MENVVKIKIENNWLMEFLTGWNYSNWKRFKNYLAVVTRDA